MPPHQKKKRKTDGEKKSSENLVWTDDEVQLLLETVLEFKNKKMYDGIDWESIKDKYEIIKNSFVSAIPEEEKKEEFPHEKNEFTKDRVSTKIKGIRVKYRKALDEGRQSGGGRVVATFFDICSQIWSGSPATESMESGVETVISTQSEESITGESSSLTNHEIDSMETGFLTDEENIGAKNEPTSSTPAVGEAVSSREKMKAMLNERRNKKIPKKIPLEQQMISISQEELSMKKEVLKQMHKQDEDFNKCMKEMQKNMETFTKVMANSMQMMTNMMFMSQQNINNPSFQTATHMNHFSPPQTPNMTHHTFFHNVPTTSTSNMSQQQFTNEFENL